MDDPTTSSGGARDQAEELAGRTAERAGTVASEAKEHAGAVAREAKDHARGLLDRARQDVVDQAQQRSGQAAGSLRSLADQLGALADGDRDRAGPLADYVHDARDRVGRLAGRLDEGPDAVLGDLRDFARRRPLVFLGAAGVLGFVAGRLVRASRADSSAGSAGSAGAGLAEPGGALGMGALTTSAGVVDLPPVPPSSAEPIVGEPLVTPAGTTPLPGSAP